jgi:transcriptional regulator with XRE-family HTH domain
MVDRLTFGQRQPGSGSRPLLRTTLGELLRRTRLLQRRTLADVARIARVSMPYLSELERGRKEASSEVLAAICDALGIELADLLAAAGRELISSREHRQVVRIGFRPAPAQAAEPVEGLTPVAAPVSPDGSDAARLLADRNDPETAGIFADADPGDQAGEVLRVLADRSQLDVLLRDTHVLESASDQQQLQDGSARSAGDAVCLLAA